ncbi:Kelch repeat-containing protein [Paludisphaera rhizosphaerae]|uniref:hypothetical protein n=1 Tax=Paludisphaera rhizosphaerae TaxID=2711216 RepID=UPI0013EC3931|nr:hypothetical protein [Paludisphaera rhizosphaerae]
MEISLDVFEQQRGRRFGGANPERMRLAFWEWIIRNQEESRLREWSESGDLIRSPYQVRRHFGQEGDYSKGPIWNFERMGASRTPHPDGRMICIAGEHEDGYDPDFCIYNDVVILDLDGSVEIYGYPRDVFPPTDFHSATLLGDRVIIIGSLGYEEDRRPGATPVFALDLRDYRIVELPSHGESPGWIHSHSATLGPDGRITIADGEWLPPQDDLPILFNFDEFAYDPLTGLWTRLTNRGWRQFLIRDAGGKSFMRDFGPLGCCSSDEEEACEEPPKIEKWSISIDPGCIRPRSFAYEDVETPFDEDWDFGKWRPNERFLVDGVPIGVDLSHPGIKLVVEGVMDPAKADQIAEECRQAVEAATGRPCLLQGDS